MTTTDRDEQIAEATRLRAEGLNYRQIGERLGCDKTAAWKLVNHEACRAHNLARNGKKRAWENAMRATCARCGGSLGAGSLRADGSQRASVAKGDTCAACRSDHRIALVLAMWRLRCDENLLNKEIAERLAIPAGTVATELTRLRALGYAVPAAPYNGADKRPPRAVACDASAVRLGRALRERGITPEHGLSAVTA